MRYIKRLPGLFIIVHRGYAAVLFLVLVLVFAVACNRELLKPDPDALPGFSTDTVTFDTVFTTIGSATLSFKVYNRSNRPLLISSIELAGGEMSFFKLNIDGEALCRVNKVEVPPDDSLFIFIALTIDPTNVNNPVVINDSIVFNTNGTLQHVNLIAYGQDVHLINNVLIESQTWTNDKPYLIYGSIAVDTLNTLTIEPGTQVFFHRNASMIIWGRLLVNGTWEDPVVFQNDRMEESYDIIAGQWGTLYIDPISRGNKINHIIIKNAITGIQIGYPSDYHVPELELSNSFIMNVSYAGIYAFGAELTCFNTVIANSAGSAVALLRGGVYSFRHCTISNNGVVGTSRSGPSIILSNTFNNAEYNELSGEYETVRCTGDLAEAEFANSIIDGNYNHEIQLVNNKTNQFNYHFDHCLLKAIVDSVNNGPPGAYIDVVLNKDPVFVDDLDRYHLDYRLDTLSPAKNAGDPQLIITYPYLEPDITGTFRNGYGNPDLGAFERKEE
jgi:hypothetical protein